MSKTINEDEVMKKCGSCIYKGKEIKDIDFDSDSFEDVETGFFECGYIKHLEDNQVSAIMKLSSNVFVIDGSGYFAAIRVNDDFGCVNHKD